MSRRWGRYDTLELVLRGHDPYPAMVVDRHWGMLSANRAFGLLIEGAAPELLEPPADVLRLALHPHGVAPKIVNQARGRPRIANNPRGAPDGGLRITFLACAAGGADGRRRVCARRVWELNSVRPVALGACSPGLLREVEQRFNGVWGLAPARGTCRDDRCDGAAPLPAALGVQAEFGCDRLSACLPNTALA